MTHSGNGQPLRYTLIHSGKMTAIAKDLYEQAKAMGKGAVFVEAMKRVLTDLETRPREFGEPAYHLYAMKLEMRKGIIDPIVVLYGVHEEKPLVFIQHFARLSN